jgi:heme exporter protein CcmD
MDFGPNAVFIVTTYAATFVILAGLVAWLALDRRYLVRMIEQMERKVRAVAPNTNSRRTRDSRR